MSSTLQTTVAKKIFAQIKVFMEDQNIGDEYLKFLQDADFESFDKKELINFSETCNCLFVIHIQDELDILKNKVRLIDNYKSQIIRLMNFKCCFPDIQQCLDDFMHPRYYISGRQIPEYGKPLHQLISNMSSLRENMAVIIKKLNNFSLDENIRNFSRVKLNELFDNLEMSTEKYLIIKRSISISAMRLSEIVSSKLNWAVEDYCLKTRGTNKMYEHDPCENIQFMYAAYQLKTLFMEVIAQEHAYINFKTGLDNINIFARLLKMFNLSIKW